MYFSNALRSKGYVGHLHEIALALRVDTLKQSVERGRNIPESHGALCKTPRDRRENYSPVACPELQAADVPCITQYDLNARNHCNTSQETRTLKEIRVLRFPALSCTDENIRRIVRELLCVHLYSHSK